MPSLALILKLSGLSILLIGALHLILGPGADALLGARLPAEIDPVRDSQNRFYGLIFACYGALAWLFGSDLRRYARVLDLLLLFLFLGGLARLLSIALVGWPTLPILLLLASELLLPPLLALWQRRELAS